MAAADQAKLVAQLVLDDKQFQAAIGRSIGGTQRLESTLSKVGGRASRGLQDTARNLERIAAIGAVGAVGLLAKSVSLASDLNEQLNKTGVVFGKASKAVVEFSETTADGLGISQADALEAAGNFGNMFKTVGLADAQAADFSTTLVTLAADMASFNNEDPSEMLDRLRSGLSGEAEPLRRFGVLISAARVEEEAYATGIAKRGEELTEAQKVQARYALILKDTALQQGDFTRTNEGFANVMRRIKANLSDAGATIGTALLPKVAELAIKFNQLIKDNGPAIQEFANKLPGAFDKALAFAEKIPWGAIAQGLESAAMWAGKLMDVFIGLPPEVQGTLIALAGLNKLSGGAITGIVGELGKGLIKGVLGINAGVVNVNAKTVAGAGGGAAGAAGKGGKLATVASAVGKVFIIGAAAAFINELVQVRNQQSEENKQQAAGVVQQSEFFANSATLEDMKKSLEGLREKQAKLTNDLTPEAIAYQLDIDGVKTTLETAIKNVEDGIRNYDQHSQASAFQIRDAVNQKMTFLGSITSQVRDAVAGTTAAARAAGQQAAFAIRDKDLSVSVSNTNVITTTISARETIKSTTTHKQYARYLS